MQDYKEMGDQFEVRLGNREVALLVGALFLVVLLAFALGVMMGKRLYGQAQGPMVTQVSGTPPATGGTSPGTDVATEPEPVATSEQYTFYNTLRDEPVDEPEPPTGNEPTDTTQPETGTPPTAAPEPAPPEPASTVTAAPAPPTPAPPPPPPPEPQGSWAIQTGTGTWEQGAKDTVRRYKNMGLDAWIGTVRSQGTTWYRVMIGHYPSYDKAKEEMDKLIAARIIQKGAFIRKE